MTTDYAERLHAAAARLTAAWPAGSRWWWWVLPRDVRAALDDLASVVEARRWPLEGE